MNKRTISIISYITILGWVFSFIVYINRGKSSLVQYHLKQSFGIGILGALISITFMSINPISLSISILFTILCLGILIFLILGIINAVNKKKAPIPLIGSMFIDRFNFIKYYH